MQWDDRIWARALALELAPAACLGAAAAYAAVRHASAGGLEGHAGAAAMVAGTAVFVATVLGLRKLDGPPPRLVLPRFQPAALEFCEPAVEEDANAAFVLQSALATLRQSRR